ncbi:MAG TPA: hypothetical protein IAB83_10935 [Candidatus Faecousia faecavium]|nr:hypothetical protein [Candidatus Faecousia faecavium]
MIYDTPIDILQLPDTVGTPMQGKLQPVFSAFCGEKEVYHNRYWESVQAGSRIDILVEMPLHREADAGMFARYKDHIYSIEQAQFGKDSDGLPVTILSLKRAEGEYDTAGI